MQKFDQASFLLLEDLSEQFESIPINTDPQFGILFQRNFSKKPRQSRNSSSFPLVGAYRENVGFIRFIEDDSSKPLISCRKQRGIRVEIIMPHMTWGHYLVFCFVKLSGVEIWKLYSGRSSMSILWS